MGSGGLPPSNDPVQAVRLDDDAEYGLDGSGPGGMVVDPDEFAEALWATQDPEGDVGSIDDSIAAWMAQWRVAAVGDRPVDHMARDLMHAALLRNHRTPWFQELARKPPGWLLQSVAHLPAGQRPQAAQHLALRLMHGRHLYHISRALAGWEATQADLDDLAALLGCRPYGAMVEWAGEGEKVHDFTCKKFRACPWCLARRAVALHDRLRRGPCRPRDGAGKHLLLARIELAGDVGGGGDPDSLDAWGVEEVRNVWGGQLVGWARGCGAVGGLLVHQVGPHVDPWAGPGYLHDLALLAEVPTAAAAQRSRLERATGIGGGGRPWLACDLPQHDEGLVWIRAAAMPADHPRALRYLWAGTDAGFDLERGGIAVNGSLDGMSWGLDGAIRLPPWFLLDATRWSSYREAMRGRHLARPFGTWRGALPRPERPEDILSTPARAASQRARRARLRPLRQHNERVADAAGDERDRALAPARSAYARLIEGSSRPVGRGRLREAMARAGHPVAERVARDLIARLRDEFGR